MMQLLRQLTGPVVGATKRAPTVHGESVGGGASRLGWGSGGNAGGDRVREGGSFQFELSILKSAAMVGDMPTFPAAPTPSFEMIRGQAIKTSVLNFCF
jgi:hypothetical protein